MFLKDTWLSHFFSKGAYRYETPFEINVNAFQPGFYFSKIPQENSNDFMCLISQGFKLIEVAVQCEQKLPLRFQEHASVKVDFSKPEDEPAVVCIAKNAFIYSRFYQDSEISKENANLIKASWVSNFFNGQRGEYMLVARVKDTVAGFLLLTQKNVIDLIAVSKDYVGKGVGTTMIAFANKNFGILKAGTQLINKPSLGMYQKNGFLITSTSYVLHKHVN